MPSIATLNHSYVSIINILIPEFWVRFLQAYHHSWCTSGSDRYSSLCCVRVISEVLCHLWIFCRGWSDWLMHLLHRRTSSGRCEELFSLSKYCHYVLERASLTGCTQKDLCRTQPRRIFSSYVNLDWDIYIDRIYRVQKINKMQTWRYSLTHSINLTFLYSLFVIYI